MEKKELIRMRVLNKRVCYIHAVSLINYVTLTNYYTEKNDSDDDDLSKFLTNMQNHNIRSINLKII
jgi:hypothetical protein